MKFEGKSGKIISIGCCFPPKFVNSGILDRALILPPWSFSPQGRSTRIFCDTERSLGNFDPKSPKVKVND